VGAVLHQGTGSVAFFSRSIAARHAKLAAYERELIGLVQAVRHWRPYLWGRQFVIRIDHRSLRFLLNQRLTTIPQRQWASKLLGFDFVVEYKPGTLNVVADALSCRDEHTAEAMALSAPQFKLSTICVTKSTATTHCPSCVMPFGAVPSRHLGQSSTASSSSKVAST
jgi:hypothetical protein